jgi:anti-sigma regulatory factor (Ser/Thr protein kinase)
MVALLWDAGDVIGAIELELLWNDLGRTLPFSLLCAYPTASVSGSERAGALGTVCHLHAATFVSESVAPSGSDGQVDGVEVARQFPATLDSARAARRFLADTLRRCRENAVLDDAAVVLTELVTNAILHSASPPTVVIRADESSILLSVHDASSVLPAPRAHGPLAQSGRGLGLVTALAARWGAHETVEGKVVWAEFDRIATRRG